MLEVARSGLRHILSHFDLGIAAFHDVRVGKLVEALATTGSDGLDVVLAEWVAVHHIVYFA